MLETTGPIARTAVATTLLLFAGSLVHAGDKDRAAKADDEAAAEEIYTVEGEVQKPKRTGGPVPTYPEAAKEERIEGVVVARILIEKDGTVSEAQIVQSLGEEFDRLALEAVRQWSFEPASLAGEPVRAHYNITINYRLDGDAKDA